MWQNLQDETSYAPETKWGDQLPVYHVLNTTGDAGTAGNTQPSG